MNHLKSLTLRARRSGLVSCASVFALIGSLGWAEQALGQTSSDDMIEEVVVTAERRSQSVRDVPSAITALDSRTMAARGIDQIGNVQFAAPNVTFGRALGATQISIRGVGRNVSAGQPGVAINIDGVYQPRNTPMIVAQADLERIEILRGPQGTLYGRNANGGAVNFITKRPGPEYGGQTIVRYQNYDEYTLQSVLNMPVSDIVSTRLVVDYTRRGDGLVKNVGNGPDLDAASTFSARGRVALDLPNNIDVDVALAGFHGSGSNDYYVPTALPNAVGIGKNPYIVNAIVPLRYNRTSALGLTNSDRDFMSGSVTVAVPLSFATIKSITAYQRLHNVWNMDRDGVDLPIVDAVANEKSNTFTQEISLSGNLGPVDWVTGLYYLDDSNKTYTYYDFDLGFAPLPVNSFLVQNTPKGKTEAKAAFADATWAITERLKLIGGIRRSTEELDLTRRNFIGNNITGVTTANTCALRSEKYDWSSTTYRAGVQFRINDNVNSYVTNATGFKAGGVNDCFNVFNPEQIKSLEGGLKGSWIQGQLTANVSAFNYDYTNFQVSQVIGIAGRVTNAGSAKIKGIELESAFAPDDHWIVELNGSMLSAKYGDFVSTDALNPTAGVQQLKGRTLSNSPKRSGSVGISYRTDETSAGRFTVRGDAFARSKVYFREFNSPEESQKGYVIYSASVAWNSPDDRYTVRAFANNIANKGYWVSMVSVDGFGARAGTYGEPRRVGVELQARY